MKCFKIHLINCEAYFGLVGFFETHFYSDAKFRLLKGTYYYLGIKHIQRIMFQTPVCQSEFCKYLRLLDTYHCESVLQNSSSEGH